MKRTILFLAIFCIGVSFLGAKERDNLEVSISVVGQGDPFFTAWGHIGINIENLETGTFHMYDYGNFSFSEEKFFVNFAFGRLIYLAMKMRAQPYINYIIRDDRDLHVYHLNLPPESERELLEYLEWNVSKENMHYLYHHYHDNCSTRIRDLVDKAIDGQLKSQTDYVRNETYRSLSRRYSENHSILGDWMTTFLQAGSIDHPITLWEEMFIPAVLGEVLETATYIDDSGEEVKLTTQVEVLCDSTRFEPVPEVFVPCWHRGLIAGLVLAALGALLAFLSVKGKKGKLALDVFQLLFALVTGIMGVVLLFMMNFTDHEVTYGNWNWLIVNPLILGYIVLFILARSKNEKTAEIGRRFMPWLWSLMALQSLICLVITALPGSYQQNLIIFLTFFPSQLLLSLPLLKPFKK